MKRFYLIAGLLLALALQACASGRSRGPTTAELTGSWQGEGTHKHIPPVGAKYDEPPSPIGIAMVLNLEESAGQVTGTAELRLDYLKDRVLALEVSGTNREGRVNLRFVFAPDVRLRPFTLSGRLTEPNRLRARLDDNLEVSLIWFERLSPAPTPSPPDTPPTPHAGRR